MSDTNYGLSWHKDWHMLYVGCPSCHHILTQVYTCLRQDNCANDGDACRCPRCGHSGTIQVKDNQATFIDWEES